MTIQSQAETEKTNCFRRKIRFSPVTASWLARIPHRYPWMPNPGTASTTKPMRIRSPAAFCQKHSVVWPNPFKILDSVPVR